MTKGPPAWSQSRHGSPDRVRQGVAAQVGQAGQPLLRVAVAHPAREQSGPLERFNVRLSRAASTFRARPISAAVGAASATSYNIRARSAKRRFRPGARRAAQAAGYRPGRIPAGWRCRLRRGPAPAWSTVSGSVSIASTSCCLRESASGWKRYRGAGGRSRRKAIVKNDPGPPPLDRHEAISPQRSSCFAWPPVRRSRRSGRIGQYRPANRPARRDILVFPLHRLPLRRRRPCPPLRLPPTS